MTEMKEIEKISNQESKVCNLKWYLGASFFLVSIAVMWFIIRALMQPVADEMLVMSHSRMVVAKIFITLSLYAVALIIGYLCNLALSKKLDTLWEQKKALFSN